MAINRSALEDLISRTSHRQNSKSWIMTCPKCGKSDKLYMLKGSGRFCCWICKETEGFQGAPEYAFAALLNMSVKAVKKLLYGEIEIQGTVHLNLQLKDWFDDDEEVEEAVELQPRGWPIDYHPIDHRFSKRGLDYLQQRGVSLEIAKMYDLRYSPDERRVIFPISSQGTLYGWQARSILPSVIETPNGDVQTVKIMTTKGLPKEHTLMYVDRLQGSQHAVLTEGPFDGIHAHWCGGNVVTMGKAVGKYQIGILRNAGIKRLYLGLDRDANDEIARIASEVGGEMELFLLFPPENYQDLGATPLETVHQAFLNAPRYRRGQMLSYADDFETVYKRRLALLRRLRA